MANKETGRTVSGICRFSTNDDNCDDCGFQMATDTLGVSAQMDDEVIIWSEVKE